jgi:hypothetical protein
MGSFNYQGKGKEKGKFHVYLSHRPVERCQPYQEAESRLKLTYCVGSKTFAVHCATPAS